MRKTTRNLLLYFLLLLSIQGYSAVFMVVNDANSGAGSLRQAVIDADAAAGPDSILIAVKGTIELFTTLDINDAGGLTIIGCYPKHIKITSSSASWAGGASPLISVKGTDVSIENIGFLGGASAANIQLVEFDSYSGENQIINCVFEGGDVPALDGGGLRFGAPSGGGTLAVRNCSFINNTARRGGAAVIDGGQGKFENCTFYKNFAEGLAAPLSGGGAVAVLATAGGGISFIHCSFKDNESGTVLGGDVIYASSGTQIYMVNCLGDQNGTSEQFAGSFPFMTGGGNGFKRNFPAESSILSALLDPTDFDLSPGMSTGMRTELLEDGYGLKYFTIVEPGSPFIDACFTSVGLTSDCRRAPRELKGNLGGGTVYGDCGAAEYTPLRVTNTATGTATPNSLQWCVNNVSTTVSVMDYIEFDIAPESVIFINNEMDPVDRVIIDAFTNPQSSVPGPPLSGSVDLTGADSLVILRNSGAANCFWMTGGASGSSISGFRITGFDFAGIALETNGAEIFGNEIGITADGNSDENAGAGIHIESGTANLIGGRFPWRRNVISGNGTAAGNMNINVTPPGGNTIIHGNLIGTTADGNNMVAGGNADYGIFVLEAPAVNIGGNSRGTRNIICGSTVGVKCNDNTDLLVLNNHIGVGWDGETVLGNQTGVELDGSGGGMAARIGNPGTFGRNVISGNNFNNIHVKVYDDVIIENNLIGLNASGDADVFATDVGILVTTSDANQIKIGNDLSDVGNYISGNEVGIRFVDIGADALIVNNKIGLATDDVTAIGNTVNGIEILDNVTNLVEIGRPNDGNVISGNSGIGVAGIFVNLTDDHWIRGNIIGLDPSGLNAVPNHIGVLVNTCSAILIGGSQGTAERNVISGNNDAGIVVNGSSANTAIRGNIIGMNLPATAPLGNTNAGIRIENAAFTTIGGAGYRNTVGGNNSLATSAGIRCESTGSSTVIENNFIGLDVSGFNEMPNSIGVAVEGAHSATIGGVTGVLNYIGGNDAEGILVNSTGAVTIDGNVIGTGFMYADLENETGIKIESGNVTVGGSSTNEILNNAGDGILIIGNGADNNVISGCLIGTNSASIVGMGNGSNGIQISDGDFNQIGTSTQGNIIVGSTFAGVYIGSTAFGNKIYNNNIGFLPGAIIPNEDGIKITAISRENEIGGTASGTRNRIAGNSQHGIFLGANSNFVYQNDIGHGGGAASIPNGANGIYLEDADSCQIGVSNPTGTSVYNVISGNTGDGIHLVNSDDNIVHGNWIGVAPDGVTAMGNSKGIFIDVDSDNTLIGSGGDGTKANTVSANTSAGIEIRGTSTKVVHNNIGVDIYATSEMGTQQIGLIITSTGTSNLVGGVIGSDHNYISGNVLRGVEVSGSMNEVTGNFFGIFSDGSVSAAPIQQQGIVLTGASCANNQIGTDPGADGGNRIVNQTALGILIADGATTNLIEGNFIGTDAFDSPSIGNPNGIEILSTAGSSNQIGTTDVGGGNLISGNSGSGIRINGADDQLVYNNRIGTIGGSGSALSNNIGIEIISGASSNNIGGPGAQGNVISGNTTYGVLIDGLTTSSNEVHGNIIGLNDAETINVGNPTGIRISNGASSNVIGDGTAGFGNTICANSDVGIDIDNSSLNEVYGNKIGPVIGNGFGVVIRNGSENNQIGASGQMNVISGNDSVGVAIVASDNNNVMNNLIGLQPSGVDALPNLVGVYVTNSTGNEIGGSGVDEGNTISANIGGGIIFETANGNFIRNNFIGTDSTGIATCVSCSNSNGILFLSSNSNTIGGNSASNEGNVISNNLGFGIRFEGSSTNNILGNTIGLGADGLNYFGNEYDGIYLISASNSNQIGSATAGDGNAIAGNPNAQLRVIGSSNNDILGNYIGNNLDGTDTLTGAYMQSRGILIQGGSVGNTIADQNIVSGINNGVGVRIEGTGTNANELFGNYIGVDASGNIALENKEGVGVEDSAQFNKIGGAGFGEEGNIIAANTTVNAFFGGNQTNSNEMKANYIGVGADGSTLFPGATTYNCGVIFGASDNDIGGLVDGEENYICGGDTVGLFLWNSIGNRVRGNFIGVTPSGADGGNGNAGIIVSGGSKHQIGGVLDASGNTIRNNPTGIEIKDDADSIAILGNSIYNNAGLGIDFGTDDVPEVNDGVLTIGSNNALIDRPEIVQAFACPGGDGSISVAFRTTLDPAFSYAFEFFANTSAGSDGEGETFIDRVTLSPVTNPDTLIFNLGAAFVVGTEITATATQIDGGLSLEFRTSEFSDGFDVTAAPATPAPTITSESCYGSGDATLEINAPDAWYFGLDGPPVDTTFESIIWAVTNGSHTYEVKYKNGCLFTDAVVVDPGPFISFDTTVWGDTCNLGTGYIGVTGITPAPTGTVFYSFNPSFVYGTVSDTSNIAAGTYQVTIYDDGLGCYSDTIDVIVPFVNSLFAAPVIESLDSIYCEGEAIDSLYITAAGSYDWFVGSTSGTADGSGQSFTPSSLNVGDNYIYVVENGVGGCTSLPDSMNYMVVDNSAMTAGDDLEICFGADVELNASGGDFYSWEWDATLDDTTIANPIAKPTQDQEYIVTISDVEGCSVTDTVRITILDPSECDVTTYNAFSPNGDGINDFLFIEGIEGWPGNKVRIFNRWGDLVWKVEDYDNDDPDKRWDGTRQLTGAPAKAGTYYYVITIKESDKHSDASWVQLLR